jgi:cytochrome c553
MKTVRIGVAIVLAVAWGVSAATRAGADDAAEAHFKYGSVGIEAEEGLPYWIWQVLPRLFADKLPGPGGYGAFGFVWEPGRELPVGFSKRDVAGSSRIAVNCAFCHTATYRVAPAAPRIVVPGGASTITSPQAFSRFLEATAADPRFNASDMLEAIGKIGTLSWTESLAYRFLLIPGTRRALLRHREEFRWMDERPDWGPGRIDPLNPFKFRQLRQPIDRTIGNSDMAPLWSLDVRDRRALHWDGLNPSLAEVLVSSAIGNGAGRRSVDLASLGLVGVWLKQLKPPRYPFPIDAARAEQGRQIFDAECAACHAENGARMGEVIPIEEIGTDRHRLDAWTAASAAAFNAFASGEPWQFRSFRKTGGYVATALAGVWLNAPYLHNGSVPALADLLEPVERRPLRFYRGYDVYDPVRVGFVGEGRDAQAAGFLFDSAEPGNSPAGHAYGTGLAPDSKVAILEYLKTL